MAYKDKELQRETTNKRVKRFREKQKITCPACGGKKYIEREHGLIRLPCPECKGK